MPRATACWLNSQGALAGDGVGDGPACKKKRPPKQRKKEEEDPKNQSEIKQVVFLDCVCVCVCVCFCGERKKKFQFLLNEILRGVILR